MKDYWPKRLGLKKSHPSGGGAADGERSLGAEGTTRSGGNAPDTDEDEDEFDRARRARFNSQDSSSTGYRDEVNRYSEDAAPDVTRDTDTVKWWGVSDQCLCVCGILTQVPAQLAKVSNPWTHFP